MPSPSRRSLLRGFLALPVAVRFAPVVAKPIQPAWLAEWDRQQSWALANVAEHNQRMREMYRSIDAYVVPYPFPQKPVRIDPAQVMAFAERLYG